MTNLSPDIRKMFGRPVFLMILCILFTAACTAQYPLTPQAEKIDRAAPYRAKLTDPERSHETLLILAFSGGGTRAASLSYGILEALDLVEVPAPPAKQGKRHMAFPYSVRETG